MQTAAREQLADLPEMKTFTISFIHTPAYSPNYNLVEYLIHLLRQKLIHHKSHKETLEETVQRIEKHLDNSQLQTAEQIKETINRIYQLPYIKR